MYFNHAFKKTFIGTHADADQVFSETGTLALIQAGVDKGFITSSVTTNGGSTYLNTMDLHSYGLGQGVYGFFDKSYNIVQSGDVSTCCPLYLVSSSIRTNDKIGKFHGGYTESNKSKLINPKYVSKLYRVDSCEGNQNVISIGTTPYTSQDAKIVTGLETLVGGTNYVTATDVVVTGGTGTGLTIDITASALAGALLSQQQELVILQLILL